MTRRLVAIMSFSLMLSILLGAEPDALIIPSPWLLKFSVITTPAIFCFIFLRMVGYNPSRLVGNGVLALFGTVLLTCANYDSPIACLVVVAFVCNATVILANGGRMPVDRELYMRGGGRPIPEGSIYCFAGNSTRLQFLCDRLHHPILGNGVYSIGDAILLFAVSLFPLQIMYRALVARQLIG